MADDFNDSLDPELKDYSGLVIGKATLGADGNVQRAEAVYVGKQQAVEGYVPRLEIADDEQHLIAKVHAQYEEDAATGRLTEDDLVLGKSGIIHERLVAALADYRREKSQQAAKKASAFEQPVALGQLPAVGISYSEYVEKLLGSSDPRLVQQESAKPVEPPQVAIDSNRGADLVAAGQSALNTLGIADLHVRPNKPAYALLQQGSIEIKLRYNWGITVDEDEQDGTYRTIVLVYDQRSAKVPVKTVAALRKLGAGAARLFIGDSKEELRSAPPIGVLGAVQVFSFGAFTFFMFLPEN